LAQMSILGLIISCPLKKAQAKQLLETTECTLLRVVAKVSSSLNLMVLCVFMFHIEWPYVFTLTCCVMFCIYPLPPYPTWVVIKLYRVMHIHEDEGLCGPTPTNHCTINWRPIAYVLWNVLASAHYIR